MFMSAKYNSLAISDSDDALWCLSCEQRVLTKRTAFVIEHLPIFRRIIMRREEMSSNTLFDDFPAFCHLLCRKRRLSKNKYVEERLIFHHPLSYENNSFVNVYTK